MARRTTRMAWAAATVLLAARLSAGSVEAAGPHLATAERFSPSGAWQARGEAPADGPAGRGELTPNQLTAGRALTSQDALAACGPAAAVAFVRATGKAVTLDAVVALARGVGWTAERGMAGPASEVALLGRLGVSATLQAGLDAARIAREVRAGRPVIVRTGGARSHYLVAERYDAATERFDFAQSALVLRGSGGRRWLALDQIASLGAGAPTHAIYLATDNNATASSAVARAAANAGGAANVDGADASGEPSRARIVDADGLGARLRAEPSTEASVVGLVSDGARLIDLGTTATAAGKLWRRVASAGGTTAWIDAELLRAAPR